MGMKHLLIPSKGREGHGGALVLFIGERTVGTNRGN